jgi:hypothetical protein
MGPRSNEIEQSYRMIAIKLDPWTLDEGPRPKSGKLRLNLHGTILEGKSIGLNPKYIYIEKRAHDLKNQDAS